MITGLSHVSLIVPNLDAAAKRLKELYGLVVGPARVNEQQGVRLAYVELPNARIELMEPARPDSPAARPASPATRPGSCAARRTTGTAPSSGSRRSARASATRSSLPAGAGR